MCATTLLYIYSVQHDCLIPRSISPSESFITSIKTIVSILVVKSYEEEMDLGTKLVGAKARCVCLF